MEGAELQPAEDPPEDHPGAGQAAVPVVRLADRRDVQQDGGAVWGKRRRTYEHTELPSDRREEPHSPAMPPSVSPNRRLRPQQLSAPGSSPSGGAASPHRCRGRRKLTGGGSSGQLALRHVSWPTALCEREKSWRRRSNRRRTESVFGAVLTAAARGLARSLRASAARPSFRR